MKIDSNFTYGGNLSEKTSLDSKKNKNPVVEENTKLPKYLKFHGGTGSFKINNIPPKQVEPKKINYIQTRQKYYTIGAEVSSKKPKISGVNMFLKKDPKRRFKKFNKTVTIIRNGQKMQKNLINQT